MVLTLPNRGPGQDASCDEMTIVVPNDLADTEGDTAGSPMTVPVRIQQVFPAAEFSQLEGPCEISGIAMRPDHEVRAEREIWIEDLTIKLSTTQVEPDVASLRFSDNVGPDETVVFEGEYRTRTEGLGPPGGPRTFDYVYVFQRPFLYDPAEGNLLGEYVSCSGRLPTERNDMFSEDSEGRGTHMLIANDCTAEWGESGAGGVVVQIRFGRSERDSFLRGDCNDNGAVDISDAVCILNWLFATREEPACVAATNTNGDGVADISDATYLLSHLFQGGPPPVAPYPECGPGPLEADDELGCANPRNCQQ